MKVNQHRKEAVGLTTANGEEKRDINQCVLRDLVLGMAMK